MTQKAGDPGPDGFTALMCYNDYMAAAAILHLRTHGVRVPEDVSVVGFDNVQQDWYDGPALTTVTLPLEEPRKGRAFPQLTTTATTTDAEGKSEFVHRSRRRSRQPTRTT